MYLSAERFTVANQAVKETFEQTCVAWQAIPHWDTGDPAQTEVPDGTTTNATFLSIVSLAEPFEVTMTEILAPTADALLIKVTAATTALAAKFDKAVIPALRVTGQPEFHTDGKPPKILSALINARAQVESAGYRAPSCLITDVNGVTTLNQLVPSGVDFLRASLTAANVNALYRTDVLEDPQVDAYAYLVGRRQRIAQAAASTASSGEEPVDLAVSVPPSLEIVGGTPNNNVRLKIRIAFATRVKDPLGLVVIRTP